MRQDSSSSSFRQQALCDQEFFLTAQQLRVTLEPDERLSNNGPQDGHDYRSHRRTLRSISVSIQPLDDDFRPCENVFWVVSRDVSQQGMGLISHEPFAHKYVRLGLVDEAATTIAEVRHNTSIGEKYPLYLVGVEFQGKLLDELGNLKPR